MTLRGFGFSLSGGIDIDSNTYPDLAVGVLNSNAVLALRTLPILHIRSFIDNNEIIQDIDQKIKECKRDASSFDYDTVCFNIDVCFEITNQTQLLQINRIPLLNYTLEAEPNKTTFNSRVYFNSTNTNIINKLIELSANRKTCHKFTVYIKKDNYDFLRPIKFLSYFKFSNKLIYDNDDEIININSNSLSDIKNFPVVHEDTNSFQFEVI